MKRIRRFSLASLPTPSLLERGSVRIFVLTTIFGINCLNGQCLNEIATGDVFSMGIKSDGTLWGWGSNIGQLGDGTGTDHWIPTQIGTSANWQSISCSGATTLAIKDNGTLWVTGNDNTGQLGLGTSGSYIATLSQQGSANNWAKIAASTYNSYGIKTNGTLWGWGQNDGGQMGNNTCCSDQTTPVQIGTDTDWKQVDASGSRSAFAIKTNGTLWGWGSNIAALLGDSSVSVWSVPTQKDTATDWDSITLGTDHALAIKTNGTLWGFGGWTYGQTGQDPNNVLFPDVPLQIPGEWSKVSAGLSFSMGIKTDGTLWAWGKNNVGQLGDGTTTNRYIPYQISTATNWVSVSCGYQFTIALRADGSLWSWGSNYYGELGNGTDSTTQAAPTAISVTGCSLAAPQFELSTTFVITPIPAHDQLQVTYKGYESITTIVVYDLNGKAVYTLPALGNAAFSSSLPISLLSAGSYIVSLQNNGKIIVSKQFVKE
ncbi:T9SS type A sorting domain-containing protein [Flavobacterium sp. XGLA_31]|uniref:RCC1 domain-containing protein n=1 Tax=Flavobacterium sp. XGLA_31 TaxID=3447666 RepID=UPI003F35559C